MIPRLSRCCCGFSLQTGSLILAWLYVIGFVLQLMAFSLYIVVEQQQKASALLQDGVHHDLSGTDFEKEQNEMVTNHIVMGFGIFCLSVNILLLIGVYKKNTCLMMPYLILALTGLGFYFIFIWFQYIASFYAPKIQGSLIYISAMGHTIHFGLAVYFWLVIYSFFRDVKDEDRNNLSVAYKA